MSISFSSFFHPFLFFHLPFIAVRSCFILFSVLPLFIYLPFNLLHSAHSRLAQVSWWITRTTTCFRRRSFGRVRLTSVRRQSVFPPSLFLLRPLFIGLFLYFPPSRAAGGSPSFLRLSRNPFPSSFFSYRALLVSSSSTSGRRHFFPPLSSVSPGSFSSSSSLSSRASQEVVLSSVSDPFPRFFSRSCSSSSLVFFASGSFSSFLSFVLSFLFSFASFFFLFFFLSFLSFFLSFLPFFFLFLLPLLFLLVFLLLLVSYFIFHPRFVILNYSFAALFLFFVNVFRIAFCLFAQSFFSLPMINESYFEIFRRLSLFADCSNSTSQAQPNLTHHVCSSSK